MVGTQLEKLTDEEKLAKRRERLIGRTVKGVLIRTRQNFSVKWNDCQFDNVYVSKRSVELSLGPRPERGIVAVVRCEIKTMGPPAAPWYLQHPYTDVVELVTRYRRRRRKSVQKWLHSGMPSALTSPQFSRDASTENSRKASIVRTARGSILDDTVLPKGIQVQYSRRGSQVIIDHGKRWEYKPPVRGPQHLPPGWEMRAVRSGGCCYFVPSPPGSRRGSFKNRRRRSQKEPQRKQRRKKKKKKASIKDKEAAMQLIASIKEQEAKRSRRSSKNRSRSKKSKSKSGGKQNKQKQKQTPKKQKQTPKKQSAKKQKQTQKQTPKKQQQKNKPTEKPKRSGGKKKSNKRSKKSSPQKNKKSILRKDVQSPRKVRKAGY